MATEKRLIDAKGKFVINAGDLTGHIMCFENGYATVFDRFAKVICKFSVLDAPTVDAVEVVRCKDCKHTRKKNGHEQFMYNENVCICTKEDIWGITQNEPVWDDGFCSFGERKDNG
jgi:hypothetical protein